MNYDFDLLNPASTTADLPQNLGAVAASTTAGVWPPVVLLCGVLLGIIILDWIIDRFSKKDHSTNMPGMVGYDPTKGSHIEGRGEDVHIPPGGRVL